MYPAVSFRLTIPCGEAPASTDSIRPSSMFAIRSANEERWASLHSSHAENVRVTGVPHAIDDFFIVCNHLTHRAVVGRQQNR